MAPVTSSRGALERFGNRWSEATRSALSQALRNASYEVLPFANAEDKVVGHVPRDVALTITATEAKGLGPTLDLAARLSGHGYAAAPHLAARLVRNDAHLVDIVAQLRDAAIDSVFVIAGDAAEPAGAFPDSLSLLERLNVIGHPFRSIGVGGYPEGHGHISDDLLLRALTSKAPFATQVITQLCFDAATTAEWAGRMQAHGVDLPIRVGIPGVISRQKLIRVSAGLGLGQSARILKKQQNMLWRFFLPGGYSPNRLIERLTPGVEQPGNNMQGFHIFTFNELDKTESWRRDWLDQLT